MTLEFTAGITTVIAAYAAEVTLLAGVTEALKAFGEATLEGNRHLAKWNGNLAVTMAQYDIGNIQREAHMAGATSGTASLRAEKQQTG